MKEEHWERLTILEIMETQYAIAESNGWHNKTPLEYLALVCSEVGEACNECRGEVPTEHLGEELADIILRVCDFAKVQGIDLPDSIGTKMAINQLTGNKGRLK